MYHICEIRSSEKPAIPTPLSKAIYNTYIENPQDENLALTVGQKIVDILRYEDYIIRKFKSTITYPLKNKARYDCGEWFIDGVRVTPTCGDGLVTIQYKDFHRGEEITATIEYPLGCAVSYNPEQKLKVLKDIEIKYYYNYQIEEIDKKIKELEEEQSNLYSELKSFEKITYSDL